MSKWRELGVDSEDTKDVSEFLIWAEEWGFEIAHCYYADLRAVLTVHGLYMPLEETRVWWRPMPAPPEQALTIPPPGR